MAAHVSILMWYTTRGPILQKKEKKVKNQVVTISLTHSPLSHTIDIIQSIPSYGRKLKNNLRNKIFLLVVIP